MPVLIVGLMVPQQLLNKQATHIAVTKPTVLISHPCCCVSRPAFAIPRQ